MSLVFRPRKLTFAKNRVLASREPRALAHQDDADKRQPEAKPRERSQMGFEIVTLLVLVLGAFVPAREDHCACTQSNRELQRKVGAAHQAASSKHFEARAQSAKAPTAVHGAPLVLEHVGWLASQPAKEHAKPSTGPLQVMGQTKEEVVGAGALQRVRLTPHGANLMPDELVHAEHTINAPRTTPRPTTAKVDSNDPNFKNSGGDLRVRV